jgi:hypothetical protein
LLHFFDGPAVEEVATGLSQQFTTIILKEVRHMKTQVASATKTIQAPVELIYRIVADYRSSHPLILPKKYFLSLEVEEGGFGEGTLLRFQMRLLGQTRSFRALVTEPEPGHILQETDLASSVVTRFTVSPAGSQNFSDVTITTELMAPGVVQTFAARIMLEKVYREELDLLASLAESRSDLSSPKLVDAAGFVEGRR